MKFTKEVLDSGLTVVKAPMSGESVTVMALIRAGSKDEFGGKWGVAHFLEHFVFKGTKKYPKVNDITKVIDGVGGIQNAFTWTDFTGYWVKVASDQIGKGMDVVSQLVCEPLLPEGEIEKEKGTIIQEIKMGEDDYPRKAWRTFQETVFPDSEIGRPVIGFEKTVAAMKIKDLKAFRDRWYYPENVVVVVAGGYSQAGGIDKMIEEKFASLSEKKKPAKRELVTQVFTQDGPRVSVVNKKTEQAHLVLGVRSFGYSDKKLYALWVANQILGGNMSSRLWNEVREKRGLAYYVGSSFFAHEKVGAFQARAGVKIGKADEAVRVIREEMLKMGNKKVSGKELEMGKEGVKGRFRLELEDSQQVADFFAEDWAMRGGKLRSPEEIVKEVDKIGVEDVMRVVGEIIKEDQFNLSMVGPFKDGGKFEKVLKG